MAIFLHYKYSVKIVLPNTVSKLHYRWYHMYLGRFALHDNQGFQEWADCILKTD